MLTLKRLSDVVDAADDSRVPVLSIAVEVSGSLVSSLQEMSSSKSGSLARNYGLSLDKFYIL